MKDMLSSLVRQLVDLPDDMLGVLCDLTKKLGGSAGTKWYTELKLFLRKEMCWEDSPLMFVGTVKLPARCGFVGRQNFICDDRPEAAVKIYLLGDGFKDSFFDKIEENIPEMELRFDALSKLTHNPDIRVKNSIHFEVIPLAHVFALLAMQPRGEEGTLLTNGLSNIFRVYGKGGELRTVFCFYQPEGWYVQGISIRIPLAFKTGSLVFYKNPTKIRLEDYPPQI